MFEEVFNEAMTSYNTGLRYLEENKLNDAAEEFNNAIDLMVSVGEENLTKEMYLYIADSFYRIAGTKVISGHYTDAILNFKSGLIACKNGNMMDTAVAGIIYYRLAEVNYITNKPSRMIYYYEKAIKALSSTPDKMIDEIMLSYERIIKALEKDKKYEEALKKLEEYEAFAKKYIGSTDDNPGYYLQEQGNIYRTIGKFKLALNCYSRALQILLEQKKFNDSILPLLESIADVQKDEFNEPQLAAAMYERAIAFGKERHLEKLQKLATCSYKAAICECKLNNKEVAKEYIDYALELIENNSYEYEDFTDHDIIKVYMIASDIYCKQEKFIEGSNFLYKAEKIALESEDRIALRKIYFNLAKVYFVMGEMEQAIDFATEADERYRDDEWDNKDLVDICNLMSKAFTKTGQDDMAAIFTQRKNIIEEENNLIK